MQATPRTHHDTAEALISAALRLRSPRWPSRRLPTALARMLPDPTRSAEAAERYLHADLERLSPSARRFEALKLRTALAELDRAEDAPEWAVERLVLLSERSAA